MVKPFTHASEQRNILAVLLEHRSGDFHSRIACRFEHELHIRKNMATVLGSGFLVNAIPEDLAVGHANRRQEAVLGQIVRRERAVEVVDDGGAEGSVHVGFLGSSRE